VGDLATECGWRLDYIMEELPLCQAFALWRAIVKRNNPEDTSPGFEDDEMVVTQDAAMRSEIAGYRRQAGRKQPRARKGI
jgi:hypothetical protein